MPQVECEPAKQPVKDYDKTLPVSGDWVFWYSMGHDNPDPAPALVLKTANEQMVLHLEIHLPGGLRFADSVHHMSRMDEVSPKLKAHNGGWAWEHPLRPSRRR